jgi:hypothetical protein
MRRQIVANQRISLDGSFTQARFLKQQSRVEIEREFCFAPGQLGGGWWLLLLEQVPSPDDLEFSGYSYLSGVAKGRLRLSQPTADQHPKDRVRDVFGLKQRTIRQRFRLTGLDCPAKVLAANGSSGDLRHRAGHMPQWKLLRALPFRVWGFVGPGHVYNGTG